MVAEQGGGGVRGWAGEWDVAFCNMGLLVGAGGGGAQAQHVWGYHLSLCLGCDRACPAFT